jgi:hypothetical protein
VSRIGGGNTVELEVELMPPTGVEIDPPGGSAMGN